MHKFVCISFCIISFRFLIRTLKSLQEIVHLFFFKPKESSFIMYIKSCSTIIVHQIVKVNNVTSFKTI